jgi:hypothetical protein
MGLGVNHWDGAVLKDYPGAVILDTSFDQSRQSDRHLVFHEGELFFLRYHRSTGRVTQESLNRSYEYRVTCSVKKKKTRRS